jgi:hypothetical protein
MPATFGDHHPLAMLGHFTHNFIGVDIDSTGADRYLHYLVLPSFTGTVATATILTPPSSIKTLKTVIDQRIKVLIGFDIDIAAIATITAIRAAFGDKFLTPEAHNAITAVTGIYFHYRFINKLHFLLRV